MIDVKQIQQESRPINKRSSDPAHEAGKAQLYPKEVGGITEWFAIDSEGTVTQITTNGSLNLPSIPSLVPSGGSKGSILSKASADDYATNWQKFHTLSQEFYFILPKAPNLADRISAGSTVSGMALNTAQNDPQADDEFGSSPDTLIMTPASLNGVVLAEVDIMELNEAGSIETQGWYKLGGIVNFKSNKALTKGGIVDLNTLLDTAKDILVRVRFIKTTMP